MRWASNPSCHHSGTGSWGVKECVATTLRQYFCLTHPRGQGHCEAASQNSALCHDSIKVCGADIKVLPRTIESG
eukprot:556690-Amphidinium_carterae.1